MKTLRSLVALGLFTLAALPGVSCVVVVNGDCGGFACSDGQCCLVACGGIDSFDQCVFPPDACIELYAPVCGCDGKTYGNACEAHGACMAIAHYGSCEGTACGAALCEPGQCCLEACGGVDPTDTCLTPPDVCGEIYAPVCGCDGNTYENACSAHAACAAIDHAGPCEEPTCGGALCGPGQCCLTSCGGTDPADQCVTPPEACPDVWAPVCGCDGVTYGNDCDAHAACVAIDYGGPCGGTCAGQTCQPGQCCLESCGGSDLVTECITPPAGCPTDIYAPVCGCDGVTYPQPCVAHEACAAIAHPGPCEVVCAYVDPDPMTGCPMGTVTCPLGGPLASCVDPTSYDECCCDLCQ